MDEFDEVENYSKTDTYTKTSLFQTTVNVVKSYIGLGILAAP
jgi:amino acid permease